MGTHLTKRERRLKYISEYQLKHRHMDKYKHLKSIGMSEVQTTRMLRRDSSMSSLAKLEHRVNFASSQYGTEGISLEGIKVTEDVKDYIKHLESQDIILPYTKGNDILRLAHPKTWEPK